MYDVFSVFAEHVRRKYNAKAGFGTLNLPMMKKGLEASGISDAVTLTPLNIAGFHMNPSKIECESCLDSFPGEILAMNVLASGAADPETAFRYLGDLKKIQNVVVGATKPEHIRQSAELSKTYLSR